MAIIEDNVEYQVIETVTANGKIVQIVNKPGSRGANSQTLLDRARTALAANATYLAITTPTAAQNTAQAKALTRQVNGLIKLLLNDLADVNGT